VEGSALVVSSCLALFGCASPEEGPVTEVDIEKLEIDGMENVYRLSPELVTGGMPDGEVGFAKLKEMGVTTVVSVAEAPRTSRPPGSTGSSTCTCR